jgi:hypothetical protein
MQRALSRQNRMIALMGGTLDVATKGSTAGIGFTVSRLSSFDTPGGSLNNCQAVIKSRQFARAESVHQEGKTWVAICALHLAQER